MSEKTYAHFIGAGGAGMSGIALVLAKRGIRVTGSDLKESRYSRALEAAGVPVMIGHAAENLGDPEVVVVSSAIPSTNPEVAAARERGIEVWPRARMLGHLAGDRKTIAVAGTHGKTTTSSMIATMLSRMDLDPTFLIGGEVDGFNANAANGTGEHYVVEADESDGSFVYLDPYIAIVTNIEADHLDHYGTLEKVEETFCDFMSRVSPGGALVVCGDQPHLVDMARSTGHRVVTYGVCDECDVRATVLGREGAGLRFEVLTADGHVATGVTTIPGVHMASNAVAALATAWVLGLDLQDASDALSQFTGVRRRFDLIGERAGVTVVDDYAHHPTEVRATLAAARTLDFKRVVVVFQPHRYSRTQALATEFGEAFGDSDLAILLDVYSAGEAPIPGVTGKTLLEAVLRAHPRVQVAYLPHRAEVVPYVKSRVRSGDVVFTMGAGDVTALGPEIVRALSEDGEAATCQ
ncbi:MAG TPA: UDP-N-acetylmuramate--L-alanine ligase [Coriobacteriia bacterium]